MMRKFTTFILTFFLFCAAFASAFAQKQEGQKWFPKVHKTKAAVAEKVASHEDTPNYKLTYNWFGGWDSSSQTNYTYMPNGNLASFQYDYYSSGMFTPSSKTIFTYDANGFQVEFLQQSWNGIAWENSFRNATSYDSKGNIAQDTYESWVSNAWQLVYGSRYTRQYNSSDQITQEISESYNNFSSMWEFSDKSDYTYASGVWVSYDFATWNGVAWQPESRVKDVTWYNFEKDLPLTALFQIYNALNSSYEDSDRLTATYSQYDSYVMIYETFGSAWENDYKEVENYDAEGHQTDYQYYSWSGAWILDGEGQNIYSYDAQGRTLEIIYRNQNSSGVLENSSKDVFSNFFVNAEAPVTPNVSVTAFPNPATTQLNFNLELPKNGPVSIVLFDLQGRKRMEATSYYNGNTMTLPLGESLENGAYFYQLKAGDSFAKGKVLIQR